MPLKDDRIDPTRADSTRIVDGYLVYSDGSSDKLDELDEDEDEDEA